MPLASRTILQMDQTAFANKSVLWNKQKRRKNSSLDSYCHLRVNRDYQKTVKNRAKALHNITNFEGYYVRENPILQVFAALDYKEEMGDSHN